jgi:hypothetical protein
MVTGVTRPVTKQNASLFLKVVNFDRSFLGRIGEPARDTLLHLRHQNAVAEMLPTFLGIVNRYNRPPACGRPSRVEDLAFWQGFSIGHRCNLCLVLLLRAARKEVDNRVGHFRPPNLSTDRRSRRTSKRIPRRQNSLAMANSYTDAATVNALDRERQFRACSSDFAIVSYQPIRQALGEWPVFAHLRRLSDVSNRRQGAVVDAGVFRGAPRFAVHEASRFGAIQARRHAALGYRSRGHVH